VYPSISRDEGPNSDWEPDEEIGSGALAVVGHFSTACRVIAPMYRQVPVTAGTDGARLWGKVDSIAYDDIVDAFKHYIANDNDSRPFVLIGHSQGAAILSTLVAEEIDPEPALQDQMLSAILLGWNVAPDEFDNIAACSEVSDTGCVVSYATYRDFEPPPADAFFGNTDAGPSLCVNPVDPAGGAASSMPYYRTTNQESFDDPAQSAEITTPWVVFPEMLTVECVDDGQFAYLELSLTTAEGPRIDNVHGANHPTWGFHFFDMNIATGDLVNLVAAQAADPDNS
jgi:hypothetical protein